MVRQDSREPAGIRCVIVTDGADGHLRQARALAQALGVRVAEHVATLQPPHSWLAPRLLAGLDPAAGSQPPLAPPWPGLAIGCGRRAALLTRWLARQPQGPATVQILDPGIAASHWDTVIAPAHDRMRGDNVIVLTGSLHPVDAQWLRRGRADFPELGRLPAPRTAVLLGGPRPGVALDEGLAMRLADSLRARQRRTGGAIMLTTSRRTPRAFAEALAGRLDDVAVTRWFGDEHGRNPYAGMLGWAERVVATPDSVNMLSEAAALGVPVHTWRPPSLPDKLARLQHDLRERGIVFDLDAVDTPAPAAMLETPRVAALISELLRARGVALTPG